MAVRRPKKMQRSREQPSLADALFGQTKQRVLGLLFGQHGRSFGTVELIDLAHSGRGAVQRELDLLTRVGLVEVEVVGLQKRYRANLQSPVFQELQRIVEKTSGIAGVVRAVLAPLRERIDLAILYGSVAKGKETSQSDVDVLIVSEDLTTEDVFRILESAEAQLGRRISPTIYSPAEFQARRQSKQAFLSKVLSGPHAVLMGTLDGARTTR